MRVITYLLSILIIISLFPAIIYSTPILSSPNYSIELFAEYAGAGSAQGLAFNSSGDLFFTSHASGEILKIPAPFHAGLNSYQICIRNYLPNRSNIYL